MCGWPSACKNFLRDKQWSLAVMCPAFCAVVHNRCCTTALLPMMRSRLSAHSPILDVYRVSACRLSILRGVRPSQAAKSRPLAKVSAGGARAAIAVAESGPMPGTVINLRDTSSSRARRDLLVEIGDLAIEAGQQV